MGGVAVAGPDLIDEIHGVISRFHRHGVADKTGTVDDIFFGAVPREGEVVVHFSGNRQ